jgi:hypothetical protein
MLSFIETNLSVIQGMNFSRSSAPLTSHAVLFLNYVGPFWILQIGKTQEQKLVAAPQC